jgi:prepilin-type N-terminal cleavage/methylation domain-containing protein
MQKINQKAFTLIELLVVIAIIGVLVTIVVVAIDPIRLINNAKDSTKRSDLQQIKAAMQLYYNACKAYPPTLPTGRWDGTDFAVSCDDNTTFMNEVPDDSGTAYSYAVSPAACTTACTSYAVGAVLSNPSTDDNETVSIQCADPDPATGNYRVCND